MARVDLRKTVYNKSQFDKVVGGRDFKSFTTEAAADTAFTVEDFFSEYDRLFLTIPINGGTNSHEFLVRKSSELVGFQRNTEDIQPLLDEITSLRDQLLSARQEIVDLQIGDVNENSLRDQFADVLEALSQPIELPDIILPDVNIDIDTDSDENEEEDEVEEITITNDPPIPKDDVIVVSIEADKTINRGSVNVLENDTDPEGDELTFIGIKDKPKYGKVEVLNPEEGVVQYIPDLRAPSGQKADQFTYVISDSVGQQGIGTVFVNITNDALLVTEPGNDVLMVDIYVDDTTRPNQTANFDSLPVNLLDNDEGLNLEFDGLVSQPRFGTITILDEQQGIVSYTPRFGSGNDEIEMGAFFTPGAGVEPVTEDEFYYRVKNLNTAARTSTAKVTVRINVFDSIVGPGGTPTPPADSENDPPGSNNNSNNSSEGDNSSSGNSNPNTPLFN